VLGGGGTLHRWLLAGKHGRHGGLVARVKFFHAAGGLRQRWVLGGGVHPLQGDQQGRVVAPLEGCVQDAAGAGVRQQVPRHQLVVYPQPLQVQ